MGLSRPCSASSADATVAKLKRPVAPASSLQTLVAYPATIDCNVLAGRRQIPPAYMPLKRYASLELSLESRNSPARFRLVSLVPNAFSRRCPYRQGICIPMQARISLSYLPPPSSRISNFHIYFENFANIIIFFLYF